MNSNDREVKELQQRICNIVCYVMWLYEKKFVSERTKDELLKLCNSSEGVNEKCTYPKKK